MKVEEWFEFKERDTDFRSEILGGVTTFAAMMYIVIVNPTLLAEGGVDFGGAYIATIIAMVIGTLIMGVFANYPIAVAPGLGIVAYFVYGIIISSGNAWQDALGAAFVAATIFLVLSLTPFRQMLIDSIPETLKLAITAGIGMFITFIGLENGKLIVSSPSTVTMLGNLSEPTAFLTLIGAFALIILMAKKVKGAIIISIFLTTLVAWLQGFIAMPDNFFSLPYGLDKTFLQLRFSNLHTMPMVIFTILLVTLFDTTGTMIGVGKQAGLIKDGKFPHLRSALMADAVASFFGAICGTGPTSSYVESGTGVAAGARTGFASVVMALLFTLLLFLAPVAEAISVESAITAPALIITGCLMLEGLAAIDWHDFTESFPTVLTTLAMPLTASITTGVGIGLITYVILKVVTGKRAELHPLLYVFAVIFIIQLGFLT